MSGFGFPYLWIPLWWLLDQAAKSWAAGIHGGVVPLIPGFLRVNLVHNHGLWIGSAMPGSVWPTWLSSAAVLLLVGLAVITPRSAVRRRWGLSFMLGGALGNTWERIRYGYVTDFLEFPILPIFNLADVMLLLGGLLIISDLFLEKPSMQTQSPQGE